MSLRSKPRADAKLKTLPPEIQEAIFKLLQRASYAKAVGMIRQQFDVETSPAGLSAFFSWYPFSRRLEQHATLADQIKQQIAANPALGLDAEKVTAIAQIAFEAQAVQEQDPTLYIGLRKLRQKDADLALQSKNQELRLKQYEDKISAAKASLEKAKGKGGVSKETLELIEQQLKLL
jgi:hypothetical protein